MESKFIFITGGVCSSLGKGIATSSIGALLKTAGLKVFTLKLDPYLNVDPGTMSPYQHGEVFVLDDGAETDLDLGHYERFIDQPLNKLSSITTYQNFEDPWSSFPKTFTNDASSDNLWPPFSIKYYESLISISSIWLIILF